MEKKRVIRPSKTVQKITPPSLLDSIGNTPLAKVDLDVAATVLAKLEYLNPGGSLKDRSARFMIQDAEQKGLLKPGGTIIDASSGNQGIALSMIGALKGYNVIITVSEKISAEKLNAMRSYGAKVVMCPVTDRIDDPKGYHSKAVKIHRYTPNSFMPNQYFNQANPTAHEQGMGPEIWGQTNGMITHFFAAAGTGGTISGVGRFLKRKNPDIKVIAVDSQNSFRSTNGNPKPYNLEGIGVDFISPVLDASVIDEFVTVSDEEGISMLKELAHKHGFLVGPSSGAVVAAVMKYSKNLSAADRAVMIFGDSGRAYLSKDFYV